MLEKGLCSLEDVHIDKVKKKTPWIEEHLVKLMYCICVPLDRCKEYKLWHCNLHERNIIISKDGTTFLVTDFGCPRLLKKRPPSRPY
jgi:RIO-like serine/threonine protein kinase